MTGLRGQPGLPNTQVFLPDWSTHHHATAEGRMTAEGTVTRPGDPVFDELAGREVQPAPTVIYDGPLWVQRMDPGAVAAAINIADRQVMVREYAVGLPLAVNGVVTAPILVNDLVTVTGCDDDQYVVDRPLRVRDVRLGTLVWQRVLICEDVAPTTR